MKKVTEIAVRRPAPKKTRAAAYCRVSTDSDAQLESLDTQKSHYEQYISAHDGWELAGIYYDEGISGTKTENRAELLRMISDCEAGRIDLVITKSISRFSRNTADCLEIIRRLSRLNIPVLFEKENIDTGSMESELFLSVLSGMAQGESTSVSDNVKWSVKRRFQDGTFKMSYAPYGYTWDGRNLIVDQYAADIVRSIFAAVLTGKGAETIAKELNAQNIPSKRGGKWTSTTILGILSNEKYVGDAVFQKTYTDESFLRHRNNGQRDKYLITDHHEAIVSREDFEAVQRLTAHRASEKGIEKGSAKYQKRYPFSGKIICGECGGIFKRRIHSGTYESYAAWCCRTHLSDKASCSMKYIRDDALQMAFVTMLNKLIYSRRLILTPYLRASRSISKDDAMRKLESLEELLAANLEQRETLTRLMSQGYIDQPLYSRENASLLTQADEYRADIEAVRAGMTGGVLKITETEKLLRFTEQSALQGGAIENFDEALFSDFVDRILAFDRNEIGFVLKCGLTLRERIGE